MFFNGKNPHGVRVLYLKCIVFKNVQETRQGFFCVVGIQVVFRQTKKYTNKVNSAFLETMVPRGGLDVWLSQTLASGLFCPSLFFPKNMYVFLTGKTLTGFESQYKKGTTVVTVVPLVPRGGLDVWPGQTYTSGLFCPSLFFSKNIYVFLTLLSLTGFESYI